MTTYNGEKLKINIWGESHSKDIGVIVEGLPIGEKIQIENVQKLLNRRRANKKAYSTSRNETDIVEYVEGVENGIITGKVVAKIENTSQKSNDYNKLFDIPRPSHADYVAKKKYGMDYNPVGGGHFSGRMTAPICIVGGICGELLKKNNINSYAYISSIGTVDGGSYDSIDVEEFDFSNLNLDFPLLNSNMKAKMFAEIENAKQDEDSVGGVIECVIQNVPVGIGDYMFSALESKLAFLLYSIPAVKAVEFGSGMNITRMRGSEANDELYFNEDGEIKTKTNHNGGINGGISNGMPITFRVAIKPTPSINKTQHTINLKTKENIELKIGGRHDACIVPRAVAVIEAVANIVIFDMLEKNR